MIRPLAFALLLFFATTARGQIQVDLKFKRLQYIAYEPVLATVTITNLAGRDVDLHDEIGHDLIVLKLYTQIISTDLRKGNIPQVRRKLKESVSLIEHALKGVRHLTFDLGPAVWSSCAGRYRICPSLSVSVGIGRQCLARILPPHRSAGLSE